MTGFMYEFNVSGFEDGDSLSGEGLIELGKLINDQWSWQWETSPDEEWEEAEKMLAELGEI